MTTRLLTQEFDYSAPLSVQAVYPLLCEGARVLAGGTDLIVKMKSADLRVDRIIDTRNIHELSFVHKNGNGLEIGALVKLSALEKSKEVAPYHALYEALPLMASVAVRNMGTLGGNIANASPAADTACPMIVYNAEVHLGSVDGIRSVALKDFFLAPGESVMKPNEMIQLFLLPAPSENSGSCFIKKTRVRPDIAKISATVHVQRKDDRIESCALAMGSVAPTPLLMDELAKDFAGQKATEQLFEKAACAVSAAIKPIDDNRSTAEYRTQVAKVIVAEAFANAWKRSGGSL